MIEDLSAVDDAQLARWAYGRAESPRLVMEPGVESVFVNQTPSELDELYLAEQRLFELTGLSISRLRTLYRSTASVPVFGESGGGKSGVGESGVGTSSGGTELACLAVVDAGVQLESTCTSQAELATCRSRS